VDYEEDVPVPVGFPGRVLEGVRGECGSRCEEAGGAVENDANLIGWFIGNEPHWARSFGSLVPWPDMLLADPEPSATKTKLQELLRRIHGKSSRSKTSLYIPVRGSTSK
jgi:hypothetical protein